jgi:parallel beta-helix repeat protein
MSDERSFERLLADRMTTERGSAQLPDSFYDDFRQRASHARQRPRWLALIKEPPMRTSSHLAVGSPTARVAAIVIATLLLALTLAGAGIAGSRLLAADGALVVDPADPSAYQTISDAVADATDGDTVLVKPGTYSESVAIDSDITVRGDGERGSIVIAFASPADGPSFLEGGPDGEPFGYGILLEASDAHVANLTLQGPPDDGTDPAVSGVYIVGGAPVIEDIDVVLFGDRWNYSGGWYYRRSAVRITGGSTATISGSNWDGYVRIFGEPNAPTFEGNTITGQDISIADGGHEPVIRGNTLLDSAALLWNEGGSGGIVEDNDISGWIGVDDGGGAANDPIIRSNRIRGGGAGDAAGQFFGVAIGIAGAATPLVEDNEIVDSATGILVTGAGAEPDIQSNTINGMTGFGIWITSGASPSIESNTIEDNRTGVAVGRDPSTATLSGNTFCGNEQDLDVPDGSDLTLDGNTVCQT